MSFKIAVYRKLVSLGLTPKIYYRELPQNPTYPATVYDFVSEVPVDLTHDVGVVGFRKARIHDAHTSSKKNITGSVAKELLPAGFWENERLVDAL